MSCAKSTGSAGETPRLMDAPLSPHIHPEYTPHIWRPVFIDKKAAERVGYKGY